MPSKEGDIKLDREIAERVMGLMVVVDPSTYRGVAIGQVGERGEDLPHYSTQMEAAMEIWDKVRKEGARWLLNVDEAGFHLRHVACVTHHGEVNEKDYRVDRPLGTAKKIEDLPQVICEVALSEMNLVEAEAEMPKNVR